MLPFSQTKFMGASIASINLNAGWNNSDGGFTIELVEDTTSSDKIYLSGNDLVWNRDGDNFNPPPVGSPVYFGYGGLSAGGILKTWSEVDSSTDARHYVVKVGSPADIVNGVQCILSGYDGAINGVPNLFNLHGYLIENTTPFEGSNCGLNIYDTDYTEDGSGMADTLPSYYQPAIGWGRVSDAGWRVNSLLEAINAIASGLGGRFGLPIRYRGYIYYLDLSELPPVNDEVRLSGENKTLMEIIQFICELTGYTFFFDLQFIAGNYYIKLKTGTSYQDVSAKMVDESTGSAIGLRLSYGVISGAIGNSVDSSRYSRGLELRNCIVNSFVTGDFRQDLWQVDIGENAPSDGTATIWPYWGKDNNGEVILGEGTSSVNTDNNGFFKIENDNYDNIHSFEVDVSHLNITEYRVNNDIEDSPYMDPVGILEKWRITVSELRAAVVSEASWKAYLETNESNKFSKINALSEISLNTAFQQQFVANLNALRAPQKEDKLPILKPMVGLHSAARQEGTTENDIQKTWADCSRLYDYVRKFATEYFGRQFMVKVPVCAGEDENAPWSYSLNWKPSDGGWAETSIIGQGRLSDMVQYFSLEDGRVEGFARFVAPNGFGILVDGLSNNDYWIINAKEIYVRIHAKEIVRVNSGDWRVVINTSGPIRCSADATTILPEFMILFPLCNDISKTQSESRGALTNTEFQKLIVNCTGFDRFALGGDFLYLMPISIAVPLQSNKLVYGPWGTPNSTTNGGTDYQRVTELSPWVFGSTESMNIAASLLVYARMSDKYVEETGEITFPGAPYGNLGAILDSGGPAISSIDVSISKGEGDVTTTYRMKTWTPDFGKMAMNRVENMRRNAMLAQKGEYLNTKARVTKEKHKIDQGAMPGMIDWRKSSRFKGQSSHDWVGCQVGPDYENDEWSSSSVMWYDYRQGDVSANPDTAQYKSRAGMELSGLFRPFSTNFKEDEVGSPYMAKYGRVEIKEGNFGGYDNGDRTSNFYGYRNPSDLYPPEDILATKHTFSYSEEQLPPIFCYEYRCPITVNTLSPFFGDNAGRLEPNNYGWKETGPSMTKDEDNSVGHDMEFILRGNIFPTKLNIREDDYNSESDNCDHWYKAVAFRGPMILSGWGFDINGRPVPNSEDNTINLNNTNSLNNIDSILANRSMYFAEDWLSKPHLWKTGPIDLRWDDKRGVWTSPPAFKLVHIALEDFLYPNECSPGQIFDEPKRGRGAGGSSDEIMALRVTVFNNIGGIFFPGQIVVAFFDTSSAKYYVISGGPLPLVTATVDEDSFTGTYIECTINGVSLNYNRGIYGNDNSILLSSLLGKKIRVEFSSSNGAGNFNSMLQELYPPYCKGTQVLMQVTGIAEDGNDFSLGNSNKSPVIGNCNYECIGSKVNVLSGVILRSNMTGYKLVEKVDMVKYTSTTTRSSTIDPGPTEEDIENGYTGLGPSPQAYDVLVTEESVDYTAFPKYLGIYTEGCCDSHARTDGCGMGDLNPSGPPATAGDMTISDPIIQIDPVTGSQNTPR